MTSWSKKMNIFVLNMGRCGSLSFTKACSHITNYSCAHESRTNQLGDERFAFPEGHIEVDNRLVWFLGRLEKEYGNRAFYVHLSRNREEVVNSYLQRLNNQNGILKAYRDAVLLGQTDHHSAAAIVADYMETIESNIRFFLRNKPHQMDFQLESAYDDFKRFWELIGAEGDLAAALTEFDIKHNPSRGTSPVIKRPLPLRAARKVWRAMIKFPDYLYRV